MKALVYNGPRDVRMATVPDPKIEEPTDVLVRVTTTNICGSDLQMNSGHAGAAMATRTWVLIKAARPNICACHAPTATV